MNEEFTELQELLQEFDSLEQKKCSGLFRLNNPTTESELEELSKSLPFALPEEMKLLLRWHNGQSNGAPSLLLEEGNLTLMPAAEIQKSFSFLNSEAVQPFEKSWLPLFTSGSGDYLVFETGQKKYGKLYHYFHDDKSRPEEYVSLIDFFEEALDILNDYTPPKKVEAFQVKEWKKIPDLNDIDFTQPGLAILFRKAEDITQHTNAQVFIKIENNQWVNGFSHSIEKAIKGASENHAKNKYVKTADVKRAGENFKPHNDLEMAEEEIGIFIGIKNN